MNRQDGPVIRISARRLRAFTLIELLVVVAIIALLIGILLPALGKARGTAQAIVCASMMKDFAVGTNAYGNENKDWLPGLNGSTIRYRYHLAWDEMNGDDEAPVQNWDWMTPVVGRGQGLPPERVARFDQLMTRYTCPSMSLDVPPYTDDEEIRAYVEANGLFHGVSYLQSGFLVWWGTEAAAAKNARRPPPGCGQMIKPVLFSSQVQVPGNYQSRIDLISNPSLKSVASDGFRYYKVSTVTPDVDVEADAGLHYGAFGTGTPVYSLSVAYGEMGGDGEGPVNIPLSYRHMERINSVFLDGHVQTLGILQSQDPTYWYPSGSTFVGGGDTAQGAFRYYEPGDKIN
ncbi:MAG: prepilin-type N-terminal cleavage/methylation domain-containing protein [Phycisphaerales bacterium]|nr:prepilin-type N-terminal cleavage/methylation domain-containing protein [Phycisphaerales bacterium]